MVAFQSNQGMGFLKFNKVINYPFTTTPPIDVIAQSDDKVGLLNFHSLDQCLKGKPSIRGCPL